MAGHFSMKTGNTGGGIWVEFLQCDYINNTSNNGSTYTFYDSVASYEDAYLATTYDSSAVTVKAKQRIRVIGTVYPDNTQIDHIYESGEVIISNLARNAGKLHSLNIILP